MVKCIPGCCRCCWNTEMMLLEEDIERIKSLGYRFEDFAYIDDQGFIRLKNVNGHCVFLDPETCRCRIYEFRPIGCKLYPIIYVEGIGPTIDSECPAKDTVTIDEFLEKSRILLKVIEKLRREARARRRLLNR